MRNDRVQSLGRLIVAALVSLPAVAVECRAVAADVSSDASDDVVVLRRCTVSYVRTAVLGPSIYGVLQERLVEPGDRVREGQLLGRLRDDDVRAELRLRELEAASDVDIRLSEAKKAQAANKLSRSAALLKRNVLSAEEYQLHRLEAEAAILETERARHEHELAQLQLRQAQAVVRSREFVSPHEGVVF